MTDEPMTCTIHEQHKNDPTTWNGMRGGWLESSTWYISFGISGMYEVTSRKLLKLLRQDEMETLHKRLSLEQPDRSLGDLYRDDVITMSQFIDLSAYLIDIIIEDITKQEMLGLEQHIPSLEEE